MTTTSRPWILLSAAIAAGLTPPCACTANSRRIAGQHLALLAGDAAIATSPTSSTLSASSPMRRRNRS